MIRPETLPMLRTLTMNDAHFETMTLINQLAAALESREIEIVKTVLDQLWNHTQEHFADEEEMMVEKRFPPYFAHKEEHDAALDEMRDAVSLFNDTQDMKKLHEYLEVNLTPWFMLHTETMDQVTSMFLENSEVHLAFWEKLKPRK